MVLLIIVKIIPKHTTIRLLKHVKRNENKHKIVLAIFSLSPVMLDLINFFSKPFLYVLSMFVLFSALRIILFPVQPGQGQQEGHLSYESHYGGRNRDIP